MKNLLIIRHGKSSWNSVGLSDHDRPLNSRGERDAPNIATALGQRGVVPDVVLSSTAVRAFTTAQIVARGLGFPEKKIIINPDIYLASPGILKRVIQQIDESAETALIFGHNPGMHELALELSGSASIHHFPTLSVARFELKIEYWAELDSGCGLLLEHLYPKMLLNN